MQMNVLRTKEVSHMGNRDDHGRRSQVATARDAGDGLLLLLLLLNKKIMSGVSLRTNC